MLSEPISLARVRHERRVRVKALWRKHGGTQHGPRVEHYTIPEDDFWLFIDELLRGERAALRKEGERTP